MQFLPPNPTVRRVSRMLFMTATTKDKTSAETRCQGANSKERIQDILELASQCSKKDVGYGRDKHGRLRKWTKLADNHPQKTTKIRVCFGRDEWATVKDDSIRDDQISVVSWNILSDTWYEAGKKYYSHTPNECGIWDGRFPILLRWLSALRPDVLALQEVDFCRFESHFLPELKKLGYDGSMQNPKNRSEDQPCGVATFWNSQKLEATKERSGSRSLAIHFRFQDRPQTHQLCVINVHLESSQSSDGAMKRARQLNSPLEWTRRMAPTAPLIVCGDFNTAADASLFHATRTQSWHGHSLSSVYEHPATCHTLPVNRATFAKPGYHYVIDHILYSHKTLLLQGALNAFTSEEIEDQLGTTGCDKGFPNAFCPSDHIPIGAIWKVAATDIPFPNEPVPTRPYRDRELANALSTGLAQIESPEVFFERDQRADRILRLMEATVEALGDTLLSDVDNKIEEKQIAKVVKKHVGNEYGKWKRSKRTTTNTE